jgi:small subunit ribosomal protein S14
MAKVSAIEKNKRRRKLVARDASKRAALKAITQNQELPIEERFRATLKLAEMPRNGAKIRVRNRCEVTGRPRASTASWACRVSHCVNSGRWPRCPAWSSRAGKEHATWQ